ncbi:MAG: GCN5-related N-acetyltransferase [Rhodoglobus sp.]|nr:GCN5-related N-acetyltransferase [Rhodoglobus sp.]
MSTLEVEVAFDDDVWKSRLQGGYTAFALEGATVTGVAVLVDDPHEVDSREIVAMWVDPAFRGRGAAGALVEHLLEQAREQGVAAVALWVADGNDGARRVYARCGFVATGQRDIMRPGLSEERMRLPLG